MSDRVVITQHSTFSDAGEEIVVTTQPHLDRHVEITVPSRVTVITVHS